MFQIKSLLGANETEALLIWWVSFLKCCHIISQTSMSTKHLMSSHLEKEKCSKEITHEIKKGENLRWCNLLLLGCGFEIIRIKYSESWNNCNSCWWEILWDLCIVSLCCSLKAVFFESSVQKNAIKPLSQRSQYLYHKKGDLMIVCPSVCVLYA